MEKPAKEVHRGVRFRTEFLSPAVPTGSRLEELKFWCSEFHQRNFAPPYGAFSQGNLSFRVRPGENAFIISGSQVGWKDRLTDDKFVTVQDCDLEKGIIFADGTRDPSSESMLHYAIYRAREDVQAIFHGHSRELLISESRMNLPETRERAPYGSIELVRGVMEILGNANFILIRKHGFISLGRSMIEAGERAIETHRLCLQGC